MTPEQWERAQELFAAGLHAEESDRGRLLGQAPREVAAEVQRLWNLHGSVGEFLESPAVVAAHRSTHQTGDVVAQRFEIIEFVASGGMGEVYRASDQLLPRVVALKVLPFHLGADPQSRDRLEREAKAISALSHPNIRTLYDLCWHGGAPVLVMELLEGETLADRLKHGPLSLDEALSVGLAVVDALVSAHNHSIIHRDLKPGNIFIAKSGVKLLDFGIAVSQQRRMDEGYIAGSPSYMSPEQASGQEVDGRSDLYSFGVVLHEMLTGQGLAEGEQSRAPSDLKALIRWCTESDAVHRPESGAVVLGVLRAVQHKRNHHRRLPLVLVLVAAALSLVGLSFFGSRGHGFYGDPVRLTIDGGRTMQPAFSRDGQLVAYASDRQGNFDIYVQPVKGGIPHRVTQSSFNETAPEFSADGQRIFFQSEEPGHGISVVPTAGGTSSVVVREGFNPKLSPDGKEIAYWAGPWPDTMGVKTHAYVIAVGGGEPVRAAPTLAGSARPVWSPDGSSLAVFGRKRDSGDLGLDVYAVRRGGGEARATGLWTRGILEQAGAQPNTFVWAQLWRGDRLYGNTRFRQGIQIFSAPVDSSLSVRGDGLEVLTMGDQRIGDLAATPDGLFAYTSTWSNQNLYRVNLHGREEDPLTALTTEVSLESYGSLSVDGDRLAYQSDREGGLSLILRDLKRGTEQKLADLTPGLTTTSVISPKGDKVAYSIAGEGGTMQIARPSEAPVRLSVHAQPVSWFDDRNVLSFVWGEDLTASWAVIDTVSGQSAALPFPINCTPAPGGAWAACGVSARDGRFEDIHIQHASGSDKTADKQIMVARRQFAIHSAYWSPDRTWLYWISRTDGRDCVYGCPMNRVTGRPRGQARAIRHLHGRQQLANNLHSSIEVRAGSIVLAMKDTVSNIWMQRAR